MIKKIAFVFSNLLIISGCLGFLIFSLFYPSDKEVPLNSIEGFVIDSNGNFYIGIRESSRIQIYNKNGAFISNWYIPTSKKSFAININSKDNIYITTVFDELFVYNNEGKLILNKFKKYKKGNNKTYTTKQGQKYEIEGTIFPRIIKTFPNKKTIIKQNIYLQSLRFLTFWIVFAFGLFLKIALNWKKIISPQQREYGSYRKQNNKKFISIPNLKIKELYIIYSFIIALLIGIIYEIKYYVNFHNFSIEHFFSLVNPLGILLMFFLAFLSRFENQNIEDNNNFNKYLIRNNCPKHKYFKWIFKQHPIFNTFIINSIIIASYFFLYLYFKTNDTPKFIYIISFILFFSFISLLNKYVVINEKKIIIYYWLLPWKKQIIYIDDINKIYEELTKNWWITYILKNNSTTVFFNFMFNQNMKKDLALLIQNLIKEKSKRVDFANN